MYGSGFPCVKRVGVWIALLVMGATPLYAGPLFDEGRYLCGDGQYKRAVKVLKRSLEREGESDESATLLLSDCYMKVKKRYRAVSVLKGGVSRHPQSWPLYFRLGALQEEDGDLFGALDSFIEASQLRPDDPTTTFRLGMAYDGTAQIEKALERYRTLYRAGSPLAPTLLNAIQGMN